MGKGTFLKNEMLDHVLGGSSYTPPTPYMALFKSATSDAGGGTEVANLYGYARTAITFASPAASGSISNSADCNFPQASGGDWETVTHAAWVDNSGYGLGNFLYHGALTLSKAVTDLDIIKFLAGTVTISYS